MTVPVFVVDTNVVVAGLWRKPKPGNRAPDPGDDHLWALLQAHDGSILISGDQLLLNNPPANRSVITPKPWHGELG
ncbi:MAG: hypothetical protein ACNA7W_07460 [Pseudomonadales bacterium]